MVTQLVSLNYSAGAEPAADVVDFGVENPLDVHDPLLEVRFRLGKKKPLLEVRSRMKSSMKRQ